jgi:hydrogenase nickel incorporation protein HypA/HybF
MHERALMRDVLARVEEVANAERAARVTRVSVRLGTLSHLTPEHFRAHFADAARGTVAEDAVVDAEVDEVGGADVLLASVEVES